MNGPNLTQFKLNPQDNALQIINNSPEPREYTYIAFHQMGRKWQSTEVYVESMILGPRQEFTCGAREQRDQTAKAFFWNVDVSIIDPNVIGTVVVEHRPTRHVETAQERTEKLLETAQMSPTLKTNETAMDDSARLMTAGYVTITPDANKEIVDKRTDTAWESERGEQPNTRTMHHERLESSPKRTRITVRRFTLDSPQSATRVKRSPRSPTQLPKPHSQPQAHAPPKQVHPSPKYPQRGSTTTQASWLEKAEAAEQASHASEHSQKSA